MGLEDRDYYREDYAKKNGMRYNARNATYRKTPGIQSNDELTRKPAAHEFSLIAKIAITFCVLLGAALIYRYLR